MSKVESYCAIPTFGEVDQEGRIYRSMCLTIEGLSEMILTASAGHLT